MPEELDQAGFVKGTRPLCPFCSAPWTDNMIKIEAYAGYCDTCDIGTGAEVTIVCESCNRLIYSKDTR